MDRHRVVVVVLAAAVSCVVHIDLDECALNTHNCDANAICTNTPGHFQCTCDTGYDGNGVSCGGNVSVSLALTSLYYRVFHRRCLRSILGISWRDHVTNDELMARSEQMALHDTVANRRRFVGHILRLPTTRPTSLALA